MKRALINGVTGVKNLRRAYTELASENIVTAQELELLDLWLANVQHLMQLGT